MIPAVLVPPVAEVGRSIVRLVAAEATQRGLAATHDPHVAHGREQDELHVAARHMSHDQRLARLAALGECVDDLRIPETPQSLAEGHTAPVIGKEEQAR